MSAISLTAAKSFLDVIHDDDDSKLQMFIAGEKFAPSLWIDPIEPCQCFSHNHACKKAIDVPVSTSKLLGFLNANIKTA